MQGVQQGPQQAQPQPQGAGVNGAAESDVRNNAPATQNTGAQSPVIDLDTLFPVPSGPPQTTAGTRESFQPYVSVVRAHQISAKVDAPCPESKRELNDMAEVYRKRMCRLVERVTHQQCYASTSFAVPGCILFLAVVYTRQELPRALKPKEVLACLPEDLQRKRIDVVTSSYRAIMSDLRTLHYSARDEIADAEMGNASPQTYWMEPPCLGTKAKDNTTSYSQKIEIMTRDPMDDVSANTQSHLRFITQTHDQVVDDSDVRGRFHEVTIDGLTCDDGFCGVTHVVREDAGNVPSSSRAALFGVFPDEIAAELNQYFYKKVQIVQEKMDDHLAAAREIVWNRIIQPLLTDMNVLFHHHNPSMRRTKESVDVYHLALNQILDFFNHQKLSYCALLIKMYCGTEREKFGVTNSTTRSTDCCGDSLHHRCSSLKRHGDDMFSTMFLSGRCVWMPNGSPCQGTWCGCLSSC